MKKYVVRIEVEPSESDFEFDFECQAMNNDHAEEQAMEQINRYEADEAHINAPSGGEPK